MQVPQLAPLTRGLVILPNLPAQGKASFVSTVKVEMPGPGPMVFMMVTADWEAVQPVASFTYTV